MPIIVVADETALSPFRLSITLLTPPLTLGLRRFGEHDPQTNYYMLWTVYILVVAGTAQALSLPFRLPSWLWFGSRSNALTIVPGKPWYNASKTVAIIGAGAGGSSTAFFIAKAKKRYGIDIDIHIYEKNEFVGGGEPLFALVYARGLNIVKDNDSVHPYDDDRYRPVELGASKHYEVDRNLARAAKEFNLTRMARKRRDDGVGIWDGSEILFTVSFSAVLSVNFAQFS